MGKQHSPAWSCKATINKFLMDLEPKSLQEIITFIKESENRDVRKDFLEIILQGDPDLYQKTDDDRWKINLDQFPAHTDAYRILQESTKALTFLQLSRKVAACLPKQQRNQITLNLEQDDRFRCIDNRKWTLAEKVNVADEVYEIMKDLEEPISERKLLKIINNQTKIEFEKILFDPQTFGDKRFYREKSDRWFLTEKRKKVSKEIPEQESSKRKKIEPIALPPERIATVEKMFSEETPILDINFMLTEVFETKRDDEDYTTLEISLIRALKKQPKFIPLSLNDLEWTVEDFIPEDAKNVPEMKIGKRIRITTWLEYGDDDYMTDLGFVEDEMLLEAAMEERKGNITANMHIERILSAFEYEHGILFLRPCDRPFFPDKPVFLKCIFYDELNKPHMIYLNNRSGFLAGLKEWYESIENPFAARFVISGNPNTSVYHLLYKREKEAFNQIPHEQQAKLMSLWERVKTDGMKTTEIMLEIMRLHTHGIDRKRLYWEINSIRFTPLRTIYGILSYFQCFEKRKGSDRWYLNEELIPNGADPEQAEYLEVRTKPRMGEWLMSPRSAERFENVINTFKDWEGREAYFAFHERTQELAREKVQKIISRRVMTEKDLSAFSDHVSDLFYAINWRKNDPDSGCWNLVLINTDKWGIFENVESANHFIDLLKTFYEEDDLAKLDAALSRFISLGVRGIQSATLSPVLFCLQPKLYAVVNKSISVGFERLTGLPMSTDLVDYIVINEMLREFLDHYELFDFSDVDGFFSHCISGRLELETYDDLMKISPIKKAMDLLMGEFDEEDVEPQAEEPEEIQFIDKELKERIDKLGHKLFSTEDLFSDLARQLMEIRIQSIWKSGDIAANFDNFLQTNYSLPQKNRFFTPRPVIKAMIKLINPKLTEKLIDLCMGTGGFLIEAGRIYREQFDLLQIQVLKNDAVKMTLANAGSMVVALSQLGISAEAVTTPEGREKLFNYIISQNITGIDNDAEAYETARLNLELNQLANANLLLADVLSKKSTISGVGANIFDIVVGTPPSTPGQTKKFIKEYMRILKPNGRLIFLASNEEISDKRLADMRKDVFKKASIKAKITLPDWDEDKYGPQSSIIMVKNNDATKSTHKLEISNLEQIGKEIDNYLANRDE